MLTIAAWKEWFATYKLCEDTANRPHIHCFGVAFSRKNDFRGPIPASGYIITHVATICVLGIINTGQTEITNLEVTVGVD